MDRVQGEVVGSAAANTEGRNLVHVKPDTIECDILVPFHKLICPEGTGLGVVPIGKHGKSRPHSTNVLAAVRVLQEDIILVTASISVITKQISYGRSP